MCLREQTYLHNQGKLIRPFSTTSKVASRTCSIPLERVIVDFGADESFERAAQKIKTHYRIDIAKSTVRAVTEKHAIKIMSVLDQIEKPEAIRHAECVIAETDGGMVPIVKINNESPDRRKVKRLEWREMRIAVAWKHKSRDYHYDALIGTPDQVGDRLRRCTQLAGADNKTKIHCVGDGAPWIADQVDSVFGTQATYVLDFYHLSSYLSEAGLCCNPDNPRMWLKEMQSLMKSNQANTVLKELSDHIYKGCPQGNNCSAEKCLKYMIKRTKQFDYKAALACDLPIGSGVVESGHRSLIQKRLKLPGAWWTEKNAQAMSKLRVLRANGLWNNYWTHATQTAFAVC